MLATTLLSPSYLLVQGGDQKGGKSMFWAFLFMKHWKED